MTPSTIDAARMLRDEASVELRAFPSEVSGPHLRLAPPLPDDDNDTDATVIPYPRRRTPPDVTVVIPAFNEGAVIGDVVRDVRQTLGASCEVIVVNDGSTDDTAIAAESAGARVVPRPRNGGNGSALKAGIRAARGEFICFMDGDGQHKAADLVRLLEQAGPYDMVVGARDSSTHASFARRMANGFYNRLASYMTGQKVKDLTSGFRVIRRSVAEEFLPLMPNGFSSPTTLTLSSMRAGYSVLYVPFKARKRVGSSKIKMLRDGGKFVIIMFKITTLFSPLKVFLPLALIPAAAMCAVLGLSFAGVARLWTCAALLGTSTLLTAGLGLVSEQICAMRFERLAPAVERGLQQPVGVWEVPF